jgi:hypothetical protein
MPKPRYDEDANVSRHGAVNADCCEDMSDKYGWKLVDVEPVKSSILSVDCVFEGDTSFPKSFHDSEE